MKVLDFSKVHSNAEMERDSGALATLDDFDRYVGSKSVVCKDVDSGEVVAVYLPNHLGKTIAAELLGLLDNAPIGTMRAQWDYEEVCRVENRLAQPIDDVPIVNLYNYLGAYTGPLLSVLGQHAPKPYRHITAITARNALPTPVHMDVYSSLQDAWSVVVTLRDGDVIGGDLIFPQYRFAINAQHGSVVLFPSKEWHGNNQIAQGHGTRRISFVLVVTPGTEDE